MDFFITDVFGTTRYTGNPLATLLHCRSLTSAEMQQIAREMNFSETTFILTETPVDTGYDVRIFTPSAEIPFAGHPTLGTAFIVQQHVIRRPVEKVTLNLASGKIDVSFATAQVDGRLWMRQAQPEFGPPVDAAAVVSALGLATSDLDPRWPVAQISTGLPQIIVPLRSLDALKRAAPARERYDQLVQSTWAKCILIFASPGHVPAHALGVRVFAGYFGVPEDPATGSANGCLAAYLVRHRCFGAASIDLVTGQGFEIGRPSELALRAREEGGVFTIDVGGRVTPVATGRWLHSGDAST
jgi:trans-2,3-dihydro-3-hydroxyanthranilate isomerase